MFEEICLTCSRQLPDDSRAYCSDECEALDVHNSPSISSASSALSSPHIDHALGGEVPALMPSALGSALSNFGKRDRYSTSSSSSSVSWSVFTDAEDDEPVVGIDDDSGYEGDCVDGTIDPPIRSVGSHHPTKPSSLMYTRRPSATNYHSMIPLLHRRTSSSSSLSHIPSPPEDELDAAHEISHQSRHELPPLSREPEKDRSTVTSRTKKSRNRASLPAYFSLLQISSPQRSHALPPSGNTVDDHPRPSPPTPKLASLLTVSALRPTLESTPRGRRREPDSSQYVAPRSHSRSRTRQGTVPEFRGCQDSRGSVEQVFDWSCAPLSRGRPTVRRNSSPLPKMTLCIQEFEDPALVAPAYNERRGRYRTQELEGRGCSRDAPGFGNGRSGLRERERTAGRW
ncbi:hypothetical protein EV363DRAFT_1319625 [Boletus edulis]|uniref:Uncharacterized protein n=1 Tax=Boletus edulis BED1 TaxID=1328754 RepID=A0AAD4C427_BOLED|nr:hypothetical protein EV363DRAFT_1319625 [Boletus edulis]KAF8447876.1 hypothetical protein L210DRAFT_3527376 [Boletus edulis BED1]